MAHHIPAGPASFMSLPRPVQETIIRHALVHSQPISSQSPILLNIGPLIFPSIMSVSFNIKELAFPIYFGENTFHFSSYHDLLQFSTGWWVSDQLRLLVRRLGLDCHFDEVRHAANVLKKFRALQDVTFGVDECQLVLYQSNRRDGLREERMRKQDINISLNLIILRIQGMDKLRALRIPGFRFTHFMHGFQPTIAHGAIHGGTAWYNEHATGPIPDGVLETIVAREIAQPKSHKRKAAASRPGPKKKPRKAKGRAAAAPAPSGPGFFDLPGEIRNQIYELALTHPKGFNPAKREYPTSHLRCKCARTKTRDGTPPPSSLALLLVNKQMSMEAVGIYYSRNTFVFYFPMQLIGFVAELPSDRKNYIENVTLWYETMAHGAVESWEVCLRMLQRFKNLENLELVLKWSQARDVDHTNLHGVSIIKELAQKGVKVRFRCQLVDNYYEHVDIQSATAAGRLNATQVLRRGNLSQLESDIETYNP